ncbi:hypothetical protein ACWGR3_30515 [Streptomyces albidoflavus]
MTDRKALIESAFKSAVNLGEYLKNAEFHLGLMPAKPLDGVDLDSARTHLQDVRGALGQIALRLADLAQAESEIRSLESMLQDIEGDTWEKVNR